jgi:hypothetical protein
MLASGGCLSPALATARRYRQGMAYPLIAAQTRLGELVGQARQKTVRSRSAVTLLADQPSPEEAVAWGATGVYRGHAGDIRILHEIDETALVYSINIGIIS